MASHTTLRLSEALLRRAKTYARQQQLTLTAVMERALTAYLSEGTPDEPRRVRLPSFGRGGARPGVDLDRSSALLDMMDDDA
jgi:non-ribosomal peptide synthetase component F